MINVKDFMIMNRNNSTTVLKVDLKDDHRQTRPEKTEKSLEHSSSKNEKHFNFQLVVL